MDLEGLKREYDRLQGQYGAKELDSIYFGGCMEKPDLCFVFMNPTKRNIASSKNWKGLKSPWIGTKNIWSLFSSLNLLDSCVYRRIRAIKGPEWTEKFASEVYCDVEKHRYFLTNLGKCTQLDARALPDSVYRKYCHLFWKELELVKPKVIILFGNQVSSIVLDEKICVSQVRKKVFLRRVNGVCYRFYCVYYPVGNGSFNIDKSIEDIKWIMRQELFNDEAYC